ncbi:Gfo/Idh/MocA family oxidoreductase [Oscillospiraceae bacterium MB08-C2-2]|nr:Gfo/Idh/MocA family oxidoreductase [Oscillospiraceae bacterium MB08-C2-2]
MQKAIQWGLVGTGRITHRFMAGFRQVSDAHMAAVCSTSMSKAEAFSQQYGVGQAFDSIEQFITRGKIDVAYISVTHPHHLYFAKKCIEAGIPVLCEKPLTPNSMQASELIQAAKINNTFLMEAFWTRCFPVALEVQEWIRTGKIGKITAIRGVMGFKATTDPTDRLIDPHEAGGALLDIGVYLINFTQFVMGKQPAQLMISARLGETGVDRTDGIVLRYDTGAIASLLCSFDCETGNTIDIMGTNGSIHVDEKFYCPQRAQLITGTQTITLESPCEGEGYQYEIRHVNECIRAGLKESPLMPLADSLANLQTCDLLRQQIGLRYPFE